jgi:DNA polymerase V
MKYPVYNQFVSASGFESPADDYLESKLSLEELLITHPAATYMVWARGDCQQPMGIFDRDLLIVNRALEPRHGDVVVALHEGQMTCKVLDLRNKRLVSTNPKYPSIAIKEGQDIQIEGVIPFSVRGHRGWPCLP